MDKKQKIFLVLGIVGVLLIIGASIFTGFKLGKRSARSGLEASISGVESASNALIDKIDAADKHLVTAIGLLTTVGTELTKFNGAVEQFGLEYATGISNLRGELSAGIDEVRKSVETNSGLYREYLDRESSIKEGAGGIEADIGGVKEVLERYKGAIP